MTWQRTDFSECAKITHVRKDLTYVERITFLPDEFIRWLEQYPNIEERIEAERREGDLEVLLTPYTEEHLSFPLDIDHDLENCNNTNADESVEKKSAGKNTKEEYGHVSELEIILRRYEGEDELHVAHIAIKYAYSDKTKEGSNEDKENFDKSKEKDKKNSGMYRGYKYEGLIVFGFEGGFSGGGTKGVHLLKNIKVYSAVKSALMNLRLDRPWANENILDSIRQLEIFRGSAGLWDVEYSNGNAVYSCHAGINYTEKNKKGVIDNVLIEVDNNSQISLIGFNYTFSFADRNDDVEHKTTIYYRFTNGKLNETSKMTYAEWFLKDPDVLNQAVHYLRVFEGEHPIHKDRMEACIDELKNVYQN